MKKLYLPIIAAMLAMPAFGETPENMNLTFTYGQNQTKQFALAKKPVVTVDGDNFVIKTTDAQETLPIAEVKTFTFTQLSTGINDVVSSDYAVTVSGGIVTVKGSDVESATDWRSRPFVASSRHLSCGCSRTRNCQSEEVNMD